MGRQWVAAVLLWTTLGAAACSPPAGSERDAAVSAAVDAGTAGVDAKTLPDAAVVCPIGWLIDESGKCVDRVCNSDGWCAEDPLPLGGFCRAIHGSDPSNVWVAGPPHLLEFDGTNWRLHAEVEPYAVWAFAKSDVWVSTSEGMRHWNGSAWDRKDIVGPSFELWGSTSKELWAVSAEAGTAKFLHWDGAQWTSVEQSGFLSWGSYLIRGSSNSNVWIFGQAAKSDAGSSEKARAFHWDGAAWAEEAVAGAAYVADALVISPTEAWALAEGGRLLGWDGTAWWSGLPAAPVSQGRLSLDGTDLVVTGFEGERFKLHQGQWQPMDPLGVTASNAWPRDAPEWAEGFGRLYRKVQGQWVRYFPRESAFLDSDLRIGPNTVFGAHDRVWLSHACTGCQGVHLFDGTSWTVALGAGGLGSAVTGTSDQDVWALTTEVGKTQLWHFDGATWSLRSSAPLPAGFGYAARVHSLGPGELWMDDGIAVARWEQPSAEHPDGQWVQPPGTESYRVIFGTYPGNLWADGESGLARWNGAQWEPVANPGISSISQGPSSESLAVGRSGETYRWDGASWQRLPGELASPAWGAFSSGKRHWACGKGHSEVAFWDGQSWSSTKVPSYCGILWGTADGVVHSISSYGITRRQYPTGP